MSLDSKSLSELRGIWQALDGKVDWSWDAAKLRRKIAAKTRVILSKPTVSVPPENQRLRTVPPARNLSQQEVWKELENYRERGLIVTFPTADTIYMRCGQREDSASLRAKLWVILDIAKTVLQ